MNSICIILTLMFYFMFTNILIKFLDVWVTLSVLSFVTLVTL